MGTFFVFSVIPNTTFVTTTDGAGKYATWNFTHPSFPGSKQSNTNHIASLASLTATFPTYNFSTGVSCIVYANNQI